MQRPWLVLLFLAIVSLGCHHTPATVSSPPAGTQGPLVSALDRPSRKLNDLPPESLKSIISNWKRPERKSLAYLKAHSKPQVEILDSDFTYHQLTDDQQFIPFVTRISFRNLSSRQLSEVKFELVNSSQSTGKDIFRSTPMTVNGFHNGAVLYFGSMEAFNYETVYLTFDIPRDSWTTDSYLHPEVVEVDTVKDEHDLHDFGNLASFMLWHSDSEVEAAFLKDPSLFKTKNFDGVNMALLAVTKSSPEVVNFMVKHGVDLGVMDTHFADAMSYATFGDDPGMMDYLLQLGFQVNGDFEKSRLLVYPLIEAILANATNSAAWLLKHGADPNFIDPRNGPPLFFVVTSPQCDDGKIFDELVQAGADIHYRDKKGNTALLLSLRGLWGVKKLVQLGISVNEPAPGTLTTPIMAAAEQGYNVTAKYLYAHGADLKAKDKKGLTVFDYAKRSNTLKTDRFFRHYLGLPGGWPSP